MVSHHEQRDQALVSHHEQKDQAKPLFPQIYLYAHMNIPRRVHFINLQNQEEDVFNLSPIQQ